jgi:ribosome-binding factor A
MSTHSRPARVAELIQRHLAEELSRGLKDPRIGFVTITGVEVSADLRNATAFFSTMGDEKQIAETLKGLNSARGFLRRQVAEGLRMRITPDLHFRYDPTMATGDRIERLLKSVQPAPAADPKPEGEDE